MKSGGIEANWTTPNISYRSYTGYTAGIVGGNCELRPSLCRVDSSSPANTEVRVMGMRDRSKLNFQQHLERRGYALHGDGSPDSVPVDAAVVDVDLDGERVLEGNGREEHLDADQKVLKKLSDCRTITSTRTITQCVRTWYPAETAPGESWMVVPSSLYMGLMIPTLSSIARRTPCQKDRKMTDLTVKNFHTGSKGLSRS